MTDKHSETVERERDYHKESVRCMSAVFDDIATLVDLPEAQRGDPDALMDAIEALKDKASLSNPAPQDEVKSVGVDFYRDAWIQEQENCIKAYELLAPHLGLKPYKCNANKEQIIWAESQEHANEVRIGESVFKYVKSAISKYHMTERK